MRARTAMRMVPTRTNPMIENGLYRLIAWLSPAFPVGGFSYSHALEAAVEAGIVSDRQSLRGYATAALEQGAGRGDAMLFAAAWRAVETSDEGGFLWAAERAAAMRGSAELALECHAQGTAFLGTVAATWPDLGIQRWRGALQQAEIVPAYPVAVALCAAASAVALRPALIAYLQGFSSALVAAGVKLIPLGQTDGQRVVAELEQIVEKAADTAMTRPLDDLGAAAPMIDLLSMHHETQYTRLFRS
ncbi:MAG TPA: urease accessory protein UreF [Alphaproteobacteria bacterium]|nr:urease accessory protein UreF [Alphaproteobacteria bacterium]